MSEIQKAARRDPGRAAEGAVLFLERVSPALEHVDSSSGAIGTAVNHAIEELVTVIARAPADARRRDGWLERLWEAHAEDAIPYIERLGTSGVSSACHRRSPRRGSIGSSRSWR